DRDAVSPHTLSIRCVRAFFGRDEAASYQPRGKGATGKCDFWLPGAPAAVTLGCLCPAREDRLLQILRRGSKALLWVVIIGVGGVFVLYLGFRGGLAREPHGDGTVVRAGKFSFDGRDLERVREQLEQHYRQALGNQFDADAARSFLTEQAGGTLLSQALLAY